MTKWLISHLSRGCTENGSLLKLLNQRHPLPIPIDSVGLTAEEGAPSKGNATQDARFGSNDFHCFPLRCKAVDKKGLSESKQPLKEEANAMLTSR